MFITQKRTSLVKLDESNLSYNVYNIKQNNIKDHYHLLKYNMLIKKQNIKYFVHKNVLRQNSRSFFQYFHELAQLCVVSEHFIDTLRHIITDFNVFETKCGECLQKRENEWIHRRKSDVSRVTLFCCRALARCCAPCSPI